MPTVIMSRSEKTGKQQVAKPSKKSCGGRYKPGQRKGSWIKKLAAVRRDAYERGAFDLHMLWFSQVHKEDQAFAERVLQDCCAATPFAVDFQDARKEKPYKTFEIVLVPGFHTLGRPRSHSIDYRCGLSLDSHVGSEFGHRCF
jgi:hypothetical protein